MWAIKHLPALKNSLGWSYGKTERKVARLAEQDELYSKYRFEKGRMIKLISIKPISEFSNEIRERSNNISKDYEILQEGFMHLYGIFKELK
ncbi:MAG: hypothetical protein ACTSWN_13890 [Promethearchaeota archaeon]